MGGAGRSRSGNAWFLTAAAKESSDDTDSTNVMRVSFIPNRAHTRANISWDKRLRVIFLWDLVIRLQDEGAVSPLGQNDGLHILPVQTATLLRVSRRLRWGEFILRGGGGIKYNYFSSSNSLNQKNLKIKTRKNWPITFLNFSQKFIKFNKK